MKTILTIVGLTCLCAPAFAQNAGPAPQTGMERPENTNGAKPDGTMDTTGMNTKRTSRPDANGSPKTQVQNQKPSNAKEPH